MDYTTEFTMRQSSSHEDVMHRARQEAESFFGEDADFLLDVSVTASRWGGQPMMVRMTATLRRCDEH